MTEKSHQKGHRKRVRKKLRENGLQAFEDYEVLEFLLMLGRPVVDVKKPAKELVKKFGNFKGTLEASESEICKVKGVGEVSYTVMQFIKQAAERYITQKQEEKSGKFDLQEIINLEKDKIGSNDDECFRVFYLDSGFHLIDQETLFPGTTNRSPVYPKPIFKKALELKASNLIFVHNHPNQEPEPTEEDKNITKKLKLAGKPLEINVFDHVIVTSQDHFSFRENDLL